MIFKTLRRWGTPEKHYGVNELFHHTSNDTLKLLAPYTVVVTPYGADTLRGFFSSSVQPL